MSKAKARRPKKPNAATPLELKDRERLIAILNDPVMQKALANIATMKPGVFFAGSGTFAHQAKEPAMATLLANNRLHQIQGWEMFETALFAQADEPRLARERTTETYPDGA